MKESKLQTSRIEQFITWLGSGSSIVLHTLIFVACFLAVLLRVVELNTMLLVLTTAVSLEAIYLALFIQMTVNRNTRTLSEVEEDIDEIQEDVEELGEDMDEIQEDIEEMSEDIDEISEDLGEIQEDVEELNEEETEEEKREAGLTKDIDELTKDIRRILLDLESLKKSK